MASDGYLLGFDVGSSSIKAALIDCATGRAAGEATSPKNELAISAPRPGWAEQDPSLWWENVVAAAAELKAATGAAFDSVKAIGITYQMHGLVLVDKAGKVLRPSIIWCDSRAVEIGEKAFHGIGEKLCLDHLLNSPGNFTASKLAWVKENEPEIFSRAAHMMLPGDWIAFRMTGERATTQTGLSEGILWDFPAGGRADMVLDWYGIPHGLVPSPSASFATMGSVTAEAATALVNTSAAPAVPVSEMPAEQCLLSRCPRSGRGRGDRGDVGCRVRHHRFTSLRSRIAGEHVRPREPCARQPPLRCADVRERHRHPVQLAPPAPGR